MTTLQKIQNLTWYNGIGKLKEILLDLFNTGGGDQNLQEVTDKLLNEDGYAVTDKGIKAEKLKVGEFESDGYGCWVNVDNNGEVIRGFEYLPYVGLYIRSADYTIFLKDGNIEVYDNEVLAYRIPYDLKDSNYTDDAEASINFVPVGGFYHTDGVLKIRLT